MVKSMCVAAGAAALLVAASTASAAPVGPLPTAQVVLQDVHRGALVALALPPTRSGTVWRVARAYDGHVATEVEERTLNSSTVIVFKAGVPGRTRIVYALTAGDTSSKALRAITLDLRVT